MKRGSWKTLWNGRGPFLPAPSQVEGPELVRLRQVGAHLARDQHEVPLPLVVASAELGEPECRSENVSELGGSEA